MSELSPLSNFLSSASAIQRNLYQNQLNINKTVERLSSGLRINHASDDPIGITLASRTKTQLIGNRQAIANNQQAISLADVATGGAQSVLGNLQRIRELTLQSMSDSTSDSDRSRIQTEVNSLVKDIDRIVNTTNFNSRNLIDGSAASFRSFERATSEILSNFTYDSETTGNTFDFLTGNIQVDPNIDVHDTILFRTSINSTTNKYTLEVRSARQGAIAYYDDLDTSPNTFHINMPTASGSGVVSIDRAPYDFERLTGPLSTAELNKPLEQLVNNDRLDPISYGTLNLNLGPNTFNVDINGSMSLQDLLNTLNGLSSGPNSVTASYNTGTGEITIGYTGQAQNTTSTPSSYTIADPAAAGGPYANFATLASQPLAQGPAYRSITLPTLSSLNSLAPSSVNTSISYTNANPLLSSNSSITNTFGLPNAGDLGSVVDFEYDFYGETVATSTPSQYVNRTRLVIKEVTAEQTSNGTINTGLTAADTTKTFEVLNTAKAPSSALINGTFTIDFGTGNTSPSTPFTYSVDPNTTTIDNIVSALNSYNPGVIIADYNDTTDRLTIENNADAHFVIGGSNGTAIANFFKLPNVPTYSNTISSSAAIDENGVFDASLELTDDDRQNTSLRALSTPKLNTLVNGWLRINGENIINIDPSTHSIADVIDAINNFSPSGNRSYTASFDTLAPGSLSIVIRDTEALANATSQPLANPGAGSPTLSANQYTLDTTAYFATGAPVYQQPTYSASALTPNGQNTPYLTVDPTAPGNVSGITFSGSTNIASVLFLANASSGTPSVVGDEFRGTAVATSHNSYTLTGDQRRTFQASSSTTSTQRLGYDTSAIDEDSIPDDGIIGEVHIIPRVAPRSDDRSLGLQVNGDNIGYQVRLNIEDLRPVDLRLEGLNLYITGDTDLQARLRGTNALKTVDQAIETTLNALNEIGATQRILENNLDGLNTKTVNLTKSLSQQQDADLTEEIGNLTQAQINVQVGSAVLAQNRANVNSLYSILFGVTGRTF